MTPVNIQFMCISSTKFTRAIVFHMEKPLFVCVLKKVQTFLSAAMISLGTKSMLAWL